MRLGQVAIAVPPYLLHPSSFLKTRVIPNLPMLICPQGGDFSLGRRLLLESVQIQKWQRSEIKAEVQVAAGPHLGRGGGGHLPRVTQAEHSPAVGAAGVPAAHPQVQPSTQASFSRVPAPGRWQKCLGEVGKGPLTRLPTLGMLLLSPPAPGRSDAKPWYPEGPASRSLLPYGLYPARRWGWLPNWESQPDR